MTVLDELADAHRLIVDADLEPVVGSTFQPTGFPNLGAATFERPGSPPMLLVESVQSMVNHLEAVGWDAPARRPAPELAGLPYVEVRHADDDAFLTSSRQEPHRLSAPYVREAHTQDGEPGVDWLIGRLGLTEGRPLDHAAVNRAVWELDPLCLVHGVFFSDPKFSASGNPKLRRAVTAVVEAEDAREAVSGGVKRDDVVFKADQKSGRGASEGYGFVPFGRTEFSAARIRLTAAVDLEQIRGYGLDADATRLLSAIALWELASLLERPLRLRTRCDLEVATVRVRRPHGVELPPAPELAAEVRRGAQKLGAGDPQVLRWSPRGKKA